ncbi:hypothetical protein KS4_12660 [Poriferisphaera corsica]|uniref:Rod shape-determining protein MreD n=1 Tax=Poriferisphaera corsica TaxID=2528020 RepID=A0A517YSN1_9BACT|nr:hypothetical protein [Poriferisphaera corsica]QDU33221.1 hypothetical protein KS4_12660 [Poriferisphaera corsica]
MNWVVFAIFAYIFLALQKGFGSLISLPEAFGGMAPSLLLIFGVYICLSARAYLALWAMLALGILTDLITTTNPSATIIGPASLGYLLAGFTIIQMRGLVFKESVFTLAILTFSAGVFAGLTTICFFKMRSFSWLTNDPIEGWDSATQMYRYFMMVLYTTVLSFPIGALLYRLSPLFRFHEKKSY